MTPHITLDPNGTGALYCQHCAELYPPSLPCTVERWIDQCRGFVLMHKHCPKPLESSKQVELFDELTKREAGERKLRDNVGHFECATCHRITGNEWDHLTHACIAKPAGIDGMSDAPDPETDPPERDADGNPLPPPPYAHLAGPVDPYADPYAKFHELYPMPDTLDGLLNACTYGLDGEQFVRLREASAGLQPGSVDFAPIANWARREHAHYDSEARVKHGAGPIAGLTIPVQLEMPPALRRLIGELKKAKRGARPLANPKPRARKAG